ncbi:hypothetical protein CHS0354_002475, partial [Potamilus streckersoni]
EVCGEVTISLFKIRMVVVVLVVLGGEGVHIYDTGGCGVFVVLSGWRTLGGGGGDMMVELLCGISDVELRDLRSTLVGQVDYRFLSWRVRLGYVVEGVLGVRQYRFLCIVVWLRYVWDVQEMNLNMIVSAQGCVYFHVMVPRVLDNSRGSEDWVSRWSGRATTRDDVTGLQDEVSNGIWIIMIMLHDDELDDTLIVIRGDDSTKDKTSIIETGVSGRVA